MDFAVARRMMVEGQIRTRDVFDPDLLAAMLELPRERFVPQAQAALAYLDRNVPVTDDGSRCLLQPMVVARLLQDRERGMQNEAQASSFCQIRFFIVFISYYNYTLR
jgi:protein-L-isoaspartate(D-aspartate) O-methyltransferase